MFCAREFGLVYSFVVMGYVALCVFVVAPSQLYRWLFVRVSLDFLQ
jgi:hypothetical protein